MVQFKEINNGYTSIYQPILDKINEEFFNQSVRCVIYSWEKMEGILGIVDEKMEGNNQIAMFFYYGEDHTIKHHYAYFDEENNIIAFSSDIGSFSLHDDVWFLTNPNGLISVVNLVPVTDKGNHFNGSIVYNQYDKARDYMVCLYYNHMYHEEKKISPLYLHDPWKILIKKRILQPTEYVLYHINYNEVTYNLVTIKEYGLKEMLEQSAYGLQHSPTISRYLRSVYLTPNFGIELFPFDKAFTKEQMEEKIHSLGFLTLPEDELIKVFNHDYAPLNFCQEVLTSFMSLENPKLTRKKDEN